MAEQTSISLLPGVKGTVHVDRAETQTARALQRVVKGTVHVEVAETLTMKAIEWVVASSSKANTFSENWRTIQKSRGQEPERQ